MNINPLINRDIQASRDSEEFMRFAMTVIDTAREYGLTDFGLSNIDSPQVKSLIRSTCFRGQITFFVFSADKEAHKSAYIGAAKGMMNEINKKYLNARYISVTVRNLRMASLILDDGDEALVADYIFDVGVMQ